MGIAHTKTLAKLAHHTAKRLQGQTGGVVDLCDPFKRDLVLAINPNTETAGFTDHVFGLMHPLGFRFAPRICDLGETKLYVPQSVQDYPTLRPMIGGTLNIKHVRAHWDEILHLVASIKQGTVTASLMLRKLGCYPGQNGLPVALR